MATDQSVLNYTTLKDIVENYSSTDGNAQWIWAARILDRMCPMMRILPMVESNNVLSNVATRTDFLPAPANRQFNSGVAPTAAHNIPISDPIALLEAYSEVDKAQWRIQNDPNAWRMDQDANHIEGFRQALENAVWYGSLASSIGGFNGLATRFNNLESYPNGDTSWVQNVWNNGSSTANGVTSIWAVEFGPQKVYGIYPRNLPAGLAVEDLGEDTKQLPTSAAGGPMLPNYYQVLRTHFTWNIGLQVADERCVQRIANINPTPLSANNFDENVLIEALRYLPSMGEAPGTVIVMNRAMKIQVDIRAVSQKINAYYTQDEGGNVWGKPVTYFQGVPIMVSEKILGTETVVQ